MNPDKTLTILHDYYINVRCMTEKEWEKFRSGYDVFVLESMTIESYKDYVEFKNMRVM